MSVMTVSLSPLPEWRVKYVRPRLMRILNLKSVCYDYNTPDEVIKIIMGYVKTHSIMPIIFSEIKCVGNDIMSCYGLDDISPDSYQHDITEALAAELDIEWRPNANKKLIEDIYVRLDDLSHHD